jgi:hypothetical protein
VDSGLATRPNTCATASTENFGWLVTVIRVILSPSTVGVQSSSLNASFDVKTFEQLVPQTQY